MQTEASPQDVWFKCCSPPPAHPAVPAPVLDLGLCFVVGHFNLREVREAFFGKVMDNNNLSWGLQIVLIVSFYQQGPSVGVILCWCQC